MNRIVDLRCPDGHVMEDIYCKPDEEPACDQCGRATSVYYGNLSRLTPRRADNFNPLDFEGKHYSSREEWDAMVRRVGANHPGEDVRVESVSRSSRRARADDVRHAGWVERKRLGIDSASAHADYKNELRRRK